jgi:hypothetical protein
MALTLRAAPPQPNGRGVAPQTAAADPTMSWESAAHAAILSSQSMIAGSAVLRDHSERLNRQAQRAVVQQQVAVNDQLAARIKALKESRRKLMVAHQTLLKTKTELAATAEHATALKNRFQRPLDKCHARSELRAKRPPVENIADPVALAVQEQSNVIEAAMQQLAALLADAAKAVADDERHLRALADDIEGKNGSIDVDEECLHFNAKAAAKVPSDMRGQDLLSPTTASKFTNDNVSLKQVTVFNLNRASTLREESLELNRKLLALMLKARKAHSAANADTKVKFAKKKEMLDKQDGRLAKQIAKMDDEQETLQGQKQSVEAALEKKRQPLELVRMRLEARRARPPLENVHDTVAVELEKELKMLADIVKSLQRKEGSINEELRQLKAQHHRMLASQHAKQCAIVIDRQCYDMEALSRMNLSSRGSAASRMSVTPSSKSARSYGDSLSSGSFLPRI